MEEGNLHEHIHILTHTKGAFFSKGFFVLIISDLLSNDMKGWLSDTDLGLDLDRNGAVHVHLHILEAFLCFYTFLESTHAGQSPWVSRKYRYTSIHFLPLGYC